MNHLNAKSLNKYHNVKSAYNTNIKMLSSLHRQRHFIAWLTSGTSA